MKLHWQRCTICKDYISYERALRICNVKGGDVSSRRMDTLTVHQRQQCVFYYTKNGDPTFVPSQKTLLGESRERSVKGERFGTRAKNDD